MNANADWRTRSNDIQNSYTNADLPDWVGEDVARLMRLANGEWLAGGHMVRESLACGTVLMATKEAGIDREPEVTAHYAKTSTNGRVRPRGNPDRVQAGGPACAASANCRR